MICVKRPINGITINGTEFLLTDSNDIMAFYNEKAAIQYLKDEGLTEGEIEAFIFTQHPDYIVTNIIEVPINGHFWGLMQGKLCVFVKHKDKLYACGEWEVPIKLEEVTFVEMINKPEYHQDTELYYQSDEQ